MLIKNFRLQLLLRVLLICATAVVLVVVVVYFNWYVTSLCLGLFMVAQIAGLTNLVEKTNRELSRFLTAIRHQDFTQRFVPDDRNNSFRELNTSFNENEPVVCRPSEALDCFLRTNMDLLVLGDLMIRRPQV